MDHVVPSLTLNWIVSNQYLYCHTCRPNSLIAFLLSISDLNEGGGGKKKLKGHYWPGKSVMCQVIMSHLCCLEHLSPGKLNGMVLRYVLIATLSDGRHQMVLLGT